MIGSMELAARSHGIVMQMFQLVSLLKAGAKVCQMNVFIQTTPAISFG
jgi:hypothetical protein